MVFQTLKRSAANRIWLATLTGSCRRFQAELACPQQTQRRLLEDLLLRNNSCAYAMAKGFAGVKTMEAYLRRAPLAAYTDHEPFVHAAARGERHMLTAEPILRLQPSSGTSAASKLIPFTRTLHEQFMNGIGPWLSRMYGQMPQIVNGSVYWSISPSAGECHSSGPIPIGFNNDGEYLGRLGRWAHAACSAVPRQAVLEASAADFHTVTMAHLLAAEDLVLISVWSPTFLISLLRHLEAHPEVVLARLCSIGGSNQYARARRVESILGKIPLGQRYRLIWPRLKLISCWTHGTSRPYAQTLAQWFPDVDVQGKGLIATEAVVSIPWGKDMDPLLAVCSHFFEFIAQDNDILLTHQLKKGGVYSMVVTTGGGLYRYRLHDLIEVTGFIEATPTLRFLAKDNLVSDHCGEKLNVAHVQRILSELIKSGGLRDVFYLLAPSLDHEGLLAYVLFIEGKTITPQLTQVLADQLDMRLKENFHYAYCRQMNQLGPARVHLLGSEPGLMQVYYAEMQRRGIKAGDVKPQALDSATGWEQRLAAFRMTTCDTVGDSLL